MAKRLKHDQLTKKILIDPLVAQEFLTYYLPTEIQKNVDLSSLTIEQESYIEESLKNKYSDVVYGLSSKKHGEIFVYILLEAQSSVDYWIALRLWKYTLLLCEKHKKEKNKLPLVYHMVIYNGKEVYDAPRNLWDLFTNPVISRQFLTADYPLINLQSMPNDEIIRKKSVGMLEYMLKHIHQRDMIKLWEEFLQNFILHILADKERGYIYLRYFLWYTDSKLPEERQSELVRVLDKYLSEEEKSNIMRTVAQKYIEEGEKLGVLKGEKLGVLKGEKLGVLKGRQEGTISIARNMLQAGSDIDFIVKVTGLSKTEIANLR